MRRSDIKTLIDAVRIIAHGIQAPDDVPMMALLEAADRLDEQSREIAALRDALGWYAQSSNWRREIRTAGPHRNWINSPAAIDRGARAKFVLLTLEGQ